MRIAFLSLLLACILTQANATPPKKGTKDASINSVISTYPFSLFSSNLKVSYENVIADQKSIIFIANYGSAEESEVYSSEYFTEAGLEVQARFWLTTKSLKPVGMFAAPFLRFKFIDYKPYPHWGGDVIGETTAQTFNIGYVLGYQYISPTGFAFTFYGGASINAPSGDYRDIASSFNGFKKGVNPNFGFSVGYGF